MDVFYSDMWYERIEQQPAFVMVSLFGEVGGFLGLLLGASILTFCEFIDYLFHMCISACHSKENVDNNNEDEDIQQEVKL